MKAPDRDGAALWQALETAYAQQYSEAAVVDLPTELARGFALLHALDLNNATKAVAVEGHRPPSGAGPDRTAYVQWLLDRLCALSMEDGLTGLFNRRYFDHRLNQELHRAVREGRPLSVLIVDADHFKTVNDRFGHTAGDHVLQTLGQLMLDALRATDDVTSRFGGEEFAVILPGTDARGAVTAAERMRAGVQAHRFDLDGETTTVTVSAGVACFDPTWASMSAADLVRYADEALYQAKAEGRNRVRLHGQLPNDPTAGGLSRAERDALLP